MNKIYSIVVVILVVIVFCFNSCKKKDTINNKIQINFINATSSNISNVTIDSITVGSLKLNEQTGFITFNNFGTDTKNPDCDFKGMLNGKNLISTSVFYWCGTEKSSLTAGKYNVEIKTIISGNEEYFDLRFK